MCWKTNPYLWLAGDHELQKGNEAALGLKRQKQPKPGRRLQVLGLSACRLFVCVCICVCVCACAYLIIHDPAICGTQIGAVPGK